MGRELQKKKRRSGVSKVTRKPKSKKQILSNPIVAANWDSTQTLSQNYARLGLSNRLNKQTGGKERFEIDKEPRQRSPSLAVHPSGIWSYWTSSITTPGGEHDAGVSLADKRQDDSEPTIPEVRVERDPVTGNILRIIEPERQRPLEANHGRPATAAEQSLLRMGRKPFNQGQMGHVNEHHDDDNDDDNDEESPGEVFTGFADSHAPEGFIGSAALIESANPVIKELSDAALAARAQPKVKRKQSERETAWCMRITAKHGSNFQAMFKDRKMNVLQLSIGQIRKKINVYLADQRVQGSLD